MSINISVRKNLVFLISYINELTKLVSILKFGINFLSRLRNQCIFFLIYIPYSSTIIRLIISILWSSSLHSIWIPPKQSYRRPLKQRNPFPHLESGWSGTQHWRKEYFGEQYTFARWGSDGYCRFLGL